MEKQEQTVTKMKQGMSYSRKEKVIILNVFKYFRTYYPHISTTEVVRRTAKATGCSEKSIFLFRKEEASPEGFKEPRKTKVRNSINMNSRDIKYDSAVRDSIRFIVYDLKSKNTVPSLSTILKKVNENPNLPTFSLMTLRRLMLDMGFYYEKNGNKFILYEKSNPLPISQLPLQENNQQDKSLLKQRKASSHNLTKQASEHIPIAHVQKPVPCVTEQVKPVPHQVHGEEAIHSQPLPLYMQCTQLTQLQTNQYVLAPTYEDLSKPHMGLDHKLEIHHQPYLDVTSLNHPQILDKRDIIQHGFMQLN